MKLFKNIDWRNVCHRKHLYVKAKEQLTRPHKWVRSKYRQKKLAFNVKILLLREVWEDRPRLVISLKRPIQEQPINPLDEDYTFLFGRPAFLDRIIIAKEHYVAKRVEDLISERQPY